MNRRNIVITGLGLIASCNVFSLENKASTKPNFIIILADDMGYSDIGCFGNTDVKTPNLNRMAAEGLLFTDCHSNGAVSTPTRAALLTGRYQQRAGLEGVILEIPEHKNVGLQPEEVTFANVLKNNGYKTAIIGKWHLGSLEKYNPLNHGFDKFVGFKTGMDLFPTMLEMADIKYDFKNKPLDGVSLLPIIKGNKIAERTLFWKRGSDCAVRDGFWKLVITGKQVLLFDLSKDLSETTNLAVSNPEVVKSLETKLQIWKQDVESGFPEQLNLNDLNTVRSE